MSYNTKIGHACRCEVCGEDMEDQNYRIGQLEGAIKGAILLLESDNDCFEVLDKMWLKEYAERNRQAITNLKQLIGEKG